MHIVTFAADKLIDGLAGIQLHAQARGRITEVPAVDLPLDANSVSLDTEMAKLSDNAMHYNTAATVTSMRIRQLLSAIRDVR